MSKKKTAKFEITMEELEVLVYILSDWRRLKSQLVEGAEYPNDSGTGTKFLRLFHAAWESLHKKTHKPPDPLD